VLPLLDRGSASGRDPRQEGVEARVQGLDRSRVPYSEAAEAEEWLAGWEQEDAGRTRQGR